MRQATLVRLILLAISILEFPEEFLSQNVVQNHSWETYTALPTTQGQVSLATGWEVLITNSDYMHDDSWAGWTPINGGAYDGGGYVGLGGYQYSPEYSEALGGYLDSPIMPGVNYSVSVALQLTNSGSSAGDFSGSCVGISIFGFDEYDTPEFFPGHLNDVSGSQLLWTSDVVDNTEWQVFTGCFQVNSQVNYIGLSLAPNITCHSYIFIDDLEIVELNENVLGDDLEICNGEEFVLSGPDFADTYSWNTGSDQAEISITESGLYWLDYTVGNCQASDTIEVFLENLETPDLGPDLTICEGQTVELDVSDYDGTIEWQDGSTESIYVIDETGTYELTVTYDVCEVSDEIEITVVEFPTMDLGPDITLCEGQVYTPLVFAEGASYVWNTGSNNSSIDITEDGLYWVEAEVLDGCSDRDSILVNFDPVPLISLPDFYSDCLGETISIIVETNAESIIWNTGENSEEIEVVNSGIYEAVVFNGDCSSSSQTTVEFLNFEMAELPERLFKCPEEKIVLNAQSESADYSWSDGSSESILTVQEAGFYWVEISNPCESTILETEVIEDQCGCQLFIPSAVTPNQDGVNDLFEVEHDCEIVQFDLLIINRWGETVFHSENSFTPWNVGLNDHFVPDGVYQYIAEYQLENDPEIYTLSGHVTVIR